METFQNAQLATPFAPAAFHKGDKIYLTKGSYEGTTGTFLSVRNDPKWADILESNSAVRAHPVEWMALSSESTKH